MPLASPAFAELHRMAVPPAYSGRPWIMALGAYFDASGNLNDPVFVIGGFLSTTERWEQFSFEWKALLAEWDLEYFHMTDFENGKGPYTEWDEGIRHERLDKLLTLIETHVIGSFLVSLSEVNFREVYGADAKPEWRYFLAARHLFWVVSQVDRDGNDLRVYSLGDTERIGWVFEAGDQGIGTIDKMYRAYYNNPILRGVFRLLSFTIGGKADYPPLQAADILAYEGFKHWPRQYANQARPERYPSNRIGNNIPHSYLNLTVETLRAQYESRRNDIDHLKL